MRRLVVLALLVPLVALAQSKPSPETPPRQPATKNLDIPVTIDGGCGVDADAVYLSAHDTSVTTSWLSSGGSFEIEFKKHPVKKQYPCLDSQGKGISVFRTSPHHASDTCNVNPKLEDTTNKYTIYWINPLNSHQKIKCNDPAVIVADSRATMIKLSSIDSIQLTAVSGASLASNDKQIIVADKCRPSAIMNLSQQDGTTLKWIAQSTDPSVTFTIHFNNAPGDVSPCWDQPKNGNPQFDYKVTNATPSGVCYVNQGAPVKDGYKYTITRTDTNVDGCPWKDALVNVRP